MAFSFCCAPLHAVRHFAQPPQGAERFRDRSAASDLLLRIFGVANLTIGFSSPIALGGYRPWLCQVAGKCPPNVAERGRNTCANADAERPGSSLFRKLNPPAADAITRWRWFRRRG